MKLQGVRRDHWPVCRLQQLGALQSSGSACQAKRRSGLSDHTGHVTVIIPPPARHRDPYSKGKLPRLKLCADTETPSEYVHVA